MFLFLEMFAEDLFEVVACYFPVEFTPVSDNFYLILLLYYCHKSIVLVSVF